MFEFLPAKRAQQGADAPEVAGAKMLGGAQGEGEARRQEKRPGKSGFFLRLPRGKKKSRFADTNSSHINQYISRAQLYVLLKTIPAFIYAQIFSCTEEKI